MCWWYWYNIEHHVGRQKEFHDTALLLLTDFVDPTLQGWLQGLVMLVETGLHLVDTIVHLLYPYTREETVIQIPHSLSAGPQKGLPNCCWLLSCHSKVFQHFDLHRLLNQKPLISSDTKYHVMKYHTRGHW